MRKLFITFAFLFSPVFAEPYLTFSSRMPAGAKQSAVGIGARTNFSHHGLDISTSVTPDKKIRNFKGRALYLFYPTPESAHRPYMGVGGQFNVFSPQIPMKLSSPMNYAPVGVLGYEYAPESKRKWFAQLEVENPDKKIRVIGLSVGFCF
jgi:hypothetical protein